MNRLDDHTNIGLDFDSTLVNGGRFSKYLWEYIRKNPNKEYWIVTFRPVSGRLGKRSDILEELVSEAGHRVGEIIGTNVAQLPDKLDHPTNFFGQPWMPLWKGSMCEQLGCTLMIDDLPKFVLPGCDAHHIEFIDTADLLEYYGG